MGAGERSGERSYNTLKFLEMENEDSRRVVYREKKNLGRCKREVMEARYWRRKRRKTVEVSEKGRMGEKVTITG